MYGWRIDTWRNLRSDVQQFADEEAARARWELALQPGTVAVLSRSTALSERLPVEVWRGDCSSMDVVE